MRKQTTIFFLFLFCIILINQAENPSAKVKESSPTTDNKPIIAPVIPHFLPEEVGMNAVTLNHIDSIAKDGIKKMIFPGCQIVVMKDGKMVYDKCFGNFSYESIHKVKPTSMYDLASLTKTTGTLLAIMKLYDNGKIKLTDKASAYLPFLRGTDKESITINELLFHESGLPGTLSFHNLVIEKNSASKNIITDSFHVNKNKVIGPVYRYKEEWASKFPSDDFSMQVADSFYLNKNIHPAEMQMIANTKLGSKTYLYSCVNFIVLKEIAETISGMPLDVFLDKEFYHPMKLNNIAYLPLRTHNKEEIVPTLKKDYLRNGILQGYVHDPAAAFLGGISGNAGLFASAQDVALVYQMLLNNGKMDDKSYLSTETCHLFTTTTSVSGRRGLGFDKPVPTNLRYNPCCLSAPLAVYGHTGYTGTCCWVDPVNNLVYVFLSNRTYPNDGVNMLTRMSIRPKIQEVIYQSLKK